MVEPAGHAYPAVQFPLQLEFIKPEVLPKVPGLHGPLHVGEFNPVVFPKYPALQFAHAPVPAAEYVPTGHTNGVDDVEPAAHVYPALQFPLQLAFVSPGVLPYSPVAHNVHTPAPPTLY